MTRFIKQRPLNFYGGLFAFAISFFIAYLDGGFFESGARIVWWNFAAGLLNIGIVFLLPKKAKVAPDNYSDMINQLSVMTENLENLKSFLHTEKIRVDETKLLIETLTQEKSELEPVINAHRETVGLILNAYEKNRGASLLKGPLVGFLIGVLSSVTATYVINLMDK